MNEPTNEATGSTWTAVQQNALDAQVNENTAAIAAAQPYLALATTALQPLDGGTFESAGLGPAFNGGSFESVGLGPAFDGGILGGEISSGLNGLITESELATPIQTAIGLALTALQPGSPGLVAGTDIAVSGQTISLSSAAQTALGLASTALQEVAADARYEPLEAFAVLPSAYTLANQTAAQQLLNTTPNGAITLPVGRYFFMCAFALTAMSTTSGSFGFGFAASGSGGNATFTQSWFSLAGKGATGFVAATAGATWATASQATLAGANVNAVAEVLIMGHINVTAAGTLIPQVSLGQAAAAIVAAGGFFRIQSVDSTAAYAGAWS